MIYRVFYTINSNRYFGNVSFLFYITTCTITLLFSVILTIIFYACPLSTIWNDACHSFNNFFCFVFVFAVVFLPFFIFLHIISCLPGYDADIISALLLIFLNFF